VGQVKAAFELGWIEEWEPSVDDLKENFYEVESKPSAQLIIKVMYRGNTIDSLRSVGDVFQFVGQLTPFCIRFVWCLRMISRRTVTDIWSIVAHERYMLQSLTSSDPVVRINKLEGDSSW
jgi:hypothetical protein